MNNICHFWFRDLKIPILKYFLALLPLYGCTFYSQPMIKLWRPETSMKKLSGLMLHAWRKIADNINSSYKKTILRVGQWSWGLRHKLWTLEEDRKQTRWTRGVLVRLVFTACAAKALFQSTRRESNPQFFFQHVLLKEIISPSMFSVVIIFAWAFN